MNKEPSRKSVCAENGTYLMLIWALADGQY